MVQQGSSGIERAFVRSGRDGSQRDVQNFERERSNCSTDSGSPRMRFAEEIRSLWGGSLHASTQPRGQEDQEDDTTIDLSVDDDVDRGASRP
jgi:hypothetical protein